MKILIIGGGGREHALAWKLAQNPRVSQLYAFPMNGGLAQLADPIPVDRRATIKELATYASGEGIDLTVVGPEALLCSGIVDVFNSRGLKVFGPPQSGAKIEGSKVWAKDFMDKYNIPTARSETFQDYEKALNYVMGQELPIVIKADGLAAGKGVTVAQTPQQAKDALHDCLVGNVFGAAGIKVIVEECLFGQEASILALTDGENILPMLPAQDHKPLLDGGQGPNTGGMGAICPTPLVDDKVYNEAMTKVFEPVLRGFQAEGIKYSGVLYAGLMVTDQGVKVLEFNCRFGDPEAQAVLPLLDSDLLGLMEATLEGQLHRTTIRWRENKTCVTVVMASKGYPGKYPKQRAIEGLDNFGQKDPDLVVFQAGTTLKGNQVVTNGGRVLGVTAVGDSPADARQKAYSAVDQIHFEGAQYRKDIGAKAL